MKMRESSIDKGDKLIQPLMRRLKIGRYENNLFDFLMIIHRAEKSLSQLFWDLSEGERRELRWIEGSFFLKSNDHHHISCSCFILAHRIAFTWENDYDGLIDFDKLSENELRSLFISAVANICCDDIERGKFKLFLGALNDGLENMRKNRACDPVMLIQVEEFISFLSMKGGVEQ